MPNEFARLSIRYKEKIRLFKGKTMASTTTMISNSENETIAFARQCAANAQNRDIFTLQGTLGMGKSVFARAFIQSLAGEDIDVPSPTFTLVQTYETTKGPIWHFDLYRIEESEEIYEIGWEEALSDGIVLIEWPERLEETLSGLMPEQRKEIIFESLSPESRKITFINHNEDK